MGQTDHVAVECVSREIILITVIYQTVKNVAMTSFRIFYYTAFFLLLYVDINSSSFIGNLQYFQELCENEKVQLNLTIYN